MTPLGKYLRKMRIDTGETMPQMARGVGVSLATLSAIETGRNEVTRKTLDKIVSYVGGPDVEHVALLSSKFIKIDMRGAERR